VGDGILVVVGDGGEASLVLVKAGGKSRLGWRVGELEEEGNCVGGMGATDSVELTESLSLGLNTITTWRRVGVSEGLLLLLLYIAEYVGLP